MSNLNERDVSEMIKHADATALATPEPVDTDIIIEGEEEQLPTRKILVIGCGDGGANIASAIYNRDRENVYCILYNTNRNTLMKLDANARLFVKSEEGVGKSRDMSKTVFRNVVKDVMNNVKIAMNEYGPFKYILICSTADGGTGSGMSVVLAKMLQANKVEVPILIMGVYPNQTEDAQAQYNALVWTNDLLDKDTGEFMFPYIIMDNGALNSGVNNIHAAVNLKATELASLLSGKGFGVTNIKQIDTRNLFRLTSHIGGRIVGVRSDIRPKSGQTLDDYIENLLAESCQPAPEGCTGIGIWVKGPKDILDAMDTSCLKLQEKYGRARLKFDHIEESDLISIGAIFTGCDQPVARLKEMRHIYDDITASSKAKENVLGDMLTGINNPMGNLADSTPTGESFDTDDMDFSAFDE